MCGTEVDRVMVHVILILPQSVKRSVGNWASWNKAAYSFMLNNFYIMVGTTLLPYTKYFSLF